MQTTISLRKMRHNASAITEVLNYKLGDVELNNLIGKEISIKFTGQIFCIECGRKTKKTFNQGYCYPCFIKLAACDLCILKPSLCHFKQGTCREPTWAADNCLQPHYVYLANSTNLKIGLTRKKKCFERWGDQGAIQAICLAEVPERKIAGDLEAELSKFYLDKSDWRKLTTSDSELLDLLAESQKAVGLISKAFQDFILPISEREHLHYEFRYPILSYPKKARTHNLDKDPLINDKLMGIKGQYLLFENALINIRKYQGYEIELGF